MTSASRTNDIAIETVALDYMHYDKFIESDDNIELKGVSLKWYNLAAGETSIPTETRLLARSFLERETTDGLLKDVRGLGFVILHRCGGDFYFLLVSTWRNENELWESVYAKNGIEQPDFEQFSFQGSHRGTFCVWELAAVWHEQQAWKRYLLSARDDTARLNYLQDSYQGAA